MPFKSKSQVRAFFAKKSKGEAGNWDGREWLRKTKSIKNLPERVKKAMCESLMKIAKELFDPMRNPPVREELEAVKNVAADYVTFSGEVSRH